MLQCFSHQLSKFCKDEVLIKDKATFTENILYRWRKQHKITTFEAKKKAKKKKEILDDSVDFDVTLKACFPQKKSCHPPGTKIIPFLVGQKLPVAQAFLCESCLQPFLTILLVQVGKMSPENFIFGLLQIKS